MHVRVCGSGGVEGVEMGAVMGRVRACVLIRAAPASGRRYTICRQIEGINSSSVVEAGGLSRGGAAVGAALCAGESESVFLSRESKLKCAMNGFDNAIAS